MYYYDFEDKEQEYNELYPEEYEDVYEEAVLNENMNQSMGEQEDYNEQVMDNLQVQMKQAYKDFFEEEKQFFKNPKIFITDQIGSMYYLLYMKLFDVFFKLVVLNPNISNLYTEREIFIDDKRSYRVHVKIVFTGNVRRLFLILGFEYKQDYGGPNKVLYAQEYSYNIWYNKVNNQFQAVLNSRDTVNTFTDSYERGDPNEQQNITDDLLLHIQTTF